MLNKFKNIVLFSFIEAIFIQLIVCVVADGVKLSSTSGLLFIFSYLANNTIIFSIVNLIFGYLPSKFKLNKLAIFLSAISFIGFGIFFVANTYVQNLYHFNINLAMLDLLINGGGEVIEITSEMIISTIVYTIILLAIYFISLLSIKFISGNITSKLLITFIVLNILTTNFMVALFSFKNTSNYLTHINKVPLYSRLSMNSFFRKLNLQSNQVTNIQTKEVSDETFNYPKNNLICNQTDFKNIIIILIDSLNAQSFDTEFFPHLSKVADENLFFANHHSGSNTTRYGVFSIFYGIYGNYFDAARTNHKPPVLLNELRKNGYEIQAFSSAQLYRPEFYQNIFLDIPNLRTNSKGDNSHERDNDAIKDFKEFMANKNNRYKAKFAFVFLDQLHSLQLYDEQLEYQKFNTPWTKPNYLELNNDFDRSIFKNLQGNIAIHIDQKISNIINYLKEIGEWDNNIVIISADHGQEFNETKKNYWGHNSNFSKWQISVPMIIHWPGTEPKKYTHKTTHYDIPATLLSDYMQCQNNISDYSIGKSIFNEKYNLKYFPVVNYNDTGLIYDDKILTFGNFSTINLYNNDYDPLDLENHKDVINDLKNYMMNQNEFSN
jgi:membrane-anchored protein YejM (alkaline phosphatase superfamily)